MGQEKETGRGTRKSIGKQADSSSRDNDDFSSHSNGRSCFDADVDKTCVITLMKGDKSYEIFKEQKRNGNGAGCDSDCTGNNSRVNIQNSDYAIRKYHLCRLECIVKKKHLVNKEGNEIVEAAIVLPVFILIILSLTGALVFQFNSIQADCTLQKEIIQEVREDKSVMRIIEKTTTNSSEAKGWYLNGFSSSYGAYGYVIDEALMLRTYDKFSS